jgi:PAT family beta-lactamase induction signal transducer AmpG
MQSSVQKTNYYNLVIITILGFSSGLPLGLTGTALQAWMADSGIDIVTIGMLGLVTQPYVYKFLWAPLLDRYNLVPKSFKFIKLGFRTSWILSTQILLAITIIYISFLDPISSPRILAVVALLIAFLSATQDIAYDAYRTELLQEHERGLGAALTTYGYRAAMLLSGGGSLLLSSYLGWQKTYALMGCLVLIVAICTLFALEPKRESPKAKTLNEVLIEPLLEFITRPYALLVLGLLITYKISEAYALALNTAFLIKHLHFSAKDVGIYSKILGFIATLIGVGIGGGLLNKLGLYRSLLYFGIMQALTNLLYWWLSIVGRDYLVLGVTIFVDQIFSGMATAAFMVLLMTLCNQKYTATQFALLSALSAFARVYVSPSSGYLVEILGWEMYYIFTCLVALPSLIILRLLKKPIMNHQLASHQA